jgi:hypothetical protein
MTLNDLTINPSNLNLETLLTDWEWAFTETVKPVLITSMGDVFVQGESKKVYLLDTVAGKPEMVATDGNAFESKLNSSEFVTNTMYPTTVSELIERFGNLPENHVYAHKKYLILGGQDTIANYEVTDAAVHFSITGQIHFQVKDLPEGTRVDQINIR